MRTARRTVVFTRPFRLPGWEEAQAAGSYVVLTDEEQLDARFPAFRRIATWIELRRGPELRMVKITPEDLEHALAADKTSAF